MKTYPSFNSVKRRSFLSSSFRRGTFVLAAICLSVGVSSPVNAATVLVDDRFIDGGVSNGADALDAAWSSVGSPSVVSFFVGAFNTVGNTSNALVGTPNGTFTTIKGGFTNTTALAIGETVTLSLDFRFTSSPASNGVGLRFGLGNSSNTYVFLSGTGASTGVEINQYAVDTAGGTALAKYATTGTAGAINDTAPHSLSFSITRTGSTSLSLQALVDGSSYGATSTGTISNFFFDRIILAEGNINVPYRLDNVNVASAIPEPSTCASMLGGLALAGVVLRRRRVVMHG